MSHIAEKNLTEEQKVLFQGKKIIDVISSEKNFEIKLDDGSTICLGEGFHQVDEREGEL